MCLDQSNSLECNYDRFLDLVQILPNPIGASLSLMKKGIHGISFFFFLLP